MELDIRKRGKESAITHIRWSDSGILHHMDSMSCLVESPEERVIEILAEEVDDLIAALQKYKELYS